MRLTPITHEKVVLLRQAIRDQVVVSFDDLDLQNVYTSRRVKPVALTRRGANLLFAGCCKTRRDFRHFVLGMMARLTVTTQRYQPSHAVLLVQWRAHDGQI
jgi:predicted DNA-binding transcriptional regulator YafY